MKNKSVINSGRSMTRVILLKLNCPDAFLMSLRPSTSNLDSSWAMSLLNVFSLRPSNRRKLTYLQTQHYSTLTSVRITSFSHSLKYKVGTGIISTYCTLFFAMVHHKDIHSNDIRSEPIVVVSDYMNHKKYAVHVFLNEVLNHLKRATWNCRLNTRSFSVMVQPNILSRSSRSVQ